MAVELADGTVMLNIRSESTPNRRIVTTSLDGVGGWSAMRFDEHLFDPVCCASLVRVGWGATALLFVSPDSRARPAKDR